MDPGDAPRAGIGWGCTIPVQSHGDGGSRRCLGVLASILLPPGGGAGPVGRWHGGQMGLSPAAGGGCRWRGVAPVTLPSISAGSSERGSVSGV